MLVKISQLFKYLSSIDTELIIALSSVAGISTLFFLYSNGLILAYGDTGTHINIARRVVDGKSIGLGQLVGSWLPLLHFLILSTVWNDFLWKSGISGSIVNIISLTFASVFLYKLVFISTSRKILGFLSVAFLVTNLNLLYFSAVPMNEMLYLGTVFPFLYYFYKWVDKKFILDLIKAAFFLFLATLNRYESWPLAFAAIFAVSISVLRWRKKNFEGPVIIFSTLALFGIVLWFVSQTLIFGSPLDFLHNEFAVQSSAKIDIAEGRLPTYHDLILSVATQFLTIFYVIGPIFCVLFVVCFILNFFQNKFDIFSPKLLVLLVCLVPFVFEIYVLYSGKVPTLVPELKPYTHATLSDFFNIRYAIYSLPLVLLSIVFVIRRNFFVFLFLFCIILNNVIVSPVVYRPIVILRDSSIVLDRSWINEGIKPDFSKHEKILISAASSDNLILGFGMGFDRYITEGSRRDWSSALLKPSDKVSAIIVQNHSKDAILNNFPKSDVMENFLLTKEVRNDSGDWIFRLYEKKDDVLDSKYCKLIVSKKCELYQTTYIYKYK